MRTFLLFVLLLTLAACENAKTPDEHISLARQYMDENSYPAATIELKNALKLDRDSAEARWLLGKIYLETEETTAAEKELQLAQKLGWQADDVRPALAQALVALDRLDEALELESTGLTSETASRLLSNQALARLLQGRVENAEELVQLSETLAPGNLQSRLVAARIMGFRGDTEGALEAIETILTVDPNQLGAWRLKGQTLLQQQRFEEARAAFDESIARSNIAFADRVERALINLHLEEYDNIETDLEDLTRISADHPGTKYIEGMLHIHNGQYRDAITALERAKPVSLQYPTLLYYLSTAYLIEKEPDIATDTVQEYLELAPGSARGRRLFAFLLIQQNQPRDAQKVLQPLLDFSPNDIGALHIMANALLLDDSDYRAFTHLQRIARLYPDTPIGELSEISGLQASGLGVASEMRQEVEKIRSRSQDVPRDELLAIVEHLQKENFDDAIALARSFQVRSLEGVARHLILAHVYIEAGQVDNAADEFNKALKGQPGNPEANAGLARLALNIGDQNAARTYYKRVLSRDANNLMILLELAKLEATMKREQAMVSSLKQAAEYHPTALAPRLGLAQYYMDAGRPEKVVGLFADLSFLQLRSPRVLEWVAVAHIAQQQFTAASATLEQLISLNPTSLHYRYLLAKTASNLGDQERAKQVLIDALTIDNLHVPSLIAAANIAVAEGQLAELEQYLETLAAVVPGVPEVLRLQAIAAQLNDETDEAVALATQAHNQAPRQQTLLTLVTSYRAAGQYAQARDVLLDWIENNPADIAALLELAHEFERAGDQNAVQKQYEAVLQLQPDNLTALNNLAWTLRFSDPEQALEYIQSASRIAPHQPQVLDTLAVIEHLNGNHETAKRTIKQALASAPGNASMRYHEAMFEAALGETEQAITTLEQLTGAEGSDFPERVDAQQLLNDLRG